MAGNPACKTFIPMLSPYIDGELDPKDRQTVERHLAACRDCTGRAADLRAESGLIRVGMEMAADDVDFTGFSQKVLAGLTPYKPPLLERWRISVSELFLYHRGLMISSAVTALVVALVAVPLLMRQSYPPGYASPKLQLISVGVDEKAHAEPRVVTTDTGDVIIWMVDTSHKAEGVEPDGNAPATSEEDEEEGVHSAQPAEDGKDKKKTLLNQERPQGGEL